MTIAATSASAPDSRTSLRDSFALHLETESEEVRLAADHAPTDAVASGARIALLIRRCRPCGAVGAGP